MKCKWFKGLQGIRNWSLCLESKFGWYLLFRFNVCVNYVIINSETKSSLSSWLHDYIAKIIFDKSGRKKMVKNVKGHFKMFFNGRIVVYKNQFLYTIYS